MRVEGLGIPLIKHDRRCGGGKRPAAADLGITADTDIAFVRLQCNVLARLTNGRGEYNIAVKIGMEKPIQSRRLSNVSPNAMMVAP